MRQIVVRKGEDKEMRRWRKRWSDARKLCWSLLLRMKFAIDSIQRLLSWPEDETAVWASWKKTILGICWDVSLSLENWLNGRETEVKENGREREWKDKVRVRLTLFVKGKSEFGKSKKILSYGKLIKRSSACMVRDSNIGRLAKRARRGIVSTVSAVLAKELEGSAASSSR